MAGSETTTADVLELEVEDLAEDLAGKGSSASLPRAPAPIARTTPGRKLQRYSPELAEKLCQELEEVDADGWPVSLRSLCENRRWPSRSAVMGWLRTKPEFREMYIEARRRQDEALLDVLIEKLATVETRAALMAAGIPTCVSEIPRAAVFEHASKVGVPVSESGARGRMVSGAYEAVGGEIDPIIK